MQGDTALLLAVRRGDVATVQALVDAKANLEARTKDVGYLSLLIDLVVAAAIRWGYRS